MSFFKRKNPNASVIPPVAPEPTFTPNPYQSQPQSRSDDAARTSLFGSRGNKNANESAIPDPYAQSSGGGRGPPSYRTNASGGGPDPYAGAGGGGGGRGASNAGDPYGDARGQLNRNELLGGFAPTEPIQKERKYGYEGREQEDDFDEEEEIEGIKQEMRGVKQESLASTRNALRIAREAEDTARGTLSKLSDQSERIANTERHLDIAKANNQRAEDKADELRQLNKSIFKPVITWDKEGKRQKQEDKINRRHLTEREDRDKARTDVAETHRRLNGAANPNNSYSSYSDRVPEPGEQARQREARKRFQFDATGSDDELEDELDDNLNETLEVTKRLKQLAMAAGEEIGAHNKRLGGITDKTSDLDLAIVKNTERVRRAGGKN